MHILNFQYVAPFQNENASKVTGVEIWCQISQLFTPPPCKN